MSQPDVPTTDVMRDKTNLIIAKNPPKISTPITIPIIRLLICANSVSLIDLVTINKPVMMMPITANAIPINTTHWMYLAILYLIESSVFAILYSALNCHPHSLTASSGVSCILYSSFASSTILSNTCIGVSP